MGLWAALHFVTRRYLVKSQRFSLETLNQNLSP